MMDKRLAQWLVGRDTGSSSEAIVARLNGAAVNPHHHPHDPDDLGRCIRLLELMPEYRARLHEMGWISPMWRNLVEHWDELVALYFKNDPDHTHRSHAPECYARMRELIEAGRAECEGILWTRAGKVESK